MCSLSESMPRVGFSFVTPLSTHSPTSFPPSFFLLVILAGPQLLLILKWGGELTSVGQRQAEELGRAFRCMYPGGEGEYASLPGSGFLRLHSTYRHDLKVYASDEGRVQMTAAAFTKVRFLDYSIVSLN